MSEYGYVYCLINEAMDNICKIGMTNTPNKTSHERAKELSASTGCPIPFVVLYDIKVKNPTKYEKILHKKLDNFRYNKNREFFKCNPMDIIDYFKMENLIEKDYDKNDFHQDYLTVYKNNTDDDIDDIDDNDDDTDFVMDKIKVNDNKNKDNKDNIDNIDIINKNNNNNINKNHQCNKCKKEFDYKYLLEKHKNRKKDCNNIENIIKNYNEKIKLINDDISNKINKSLDIEIKCLLCEKNFSNKANTKKHINLACPIKKQLEFNIINIENEKNKLIEENKFFKQQNEILELRKNMKEMYDFIKDFKKS